MAETHQKIEEHLPVEIVSSYENGAKENTLTKAMIDGEEWKIVESFSREGIRTELIQVSSTGVPVRKIKYDEQGRAIEIFMPQASRHQPAFTLTLNPENGTPKSIVLDSKITGETHRGTFKNSKTLILQIPDPEKENGITVKKMQTKEVNLDNPSTSAGMFKVAIARAHIQMPGIVLGVPESPLHYKIISMWPSGTAKRALGVKPQDENEGKHEPLELVYDQNGDCKYTKEVMTGQQRLSAFESDHDPVTGISSGHHVGDLIIATPEGVIAQYAHFHSNGKKQYHCLFRQPEGERRIDLDYEHFDPHGKLLKQINGIPLDSIGNDEYGQQLSSEQERARHILEYILLRHFAPLANQFDLPFTPYEEITLNQNVQHPVNRLLKSWKESSDFQVATYKGDFDGHSAEARMYYKDKRRQHFIQYKPDGKPFRQVWYDHSGSAVQMDYFGNESAPMVSVLLREDGKTDAIIDVKGKTVCRFDQHPDVLTIEKYENFSNHPIHSEEHPACEWEHVLGLGTSTLVALLKTEIPGVDLGLRHGEQNNILNVYPSGIQKTTQFGDEIYPLIVVYDEKARLLLHLTRKSTSERLEFLDDEFNTLGECTINNNGTREIKWFQKPKTGDEKPVLQTKIEINNNGQFVAKNYGEDGKVATQTKSLPVQRLFGRLYPDDHNSGAALVQIPEKLKEMYPEALKELEKFNQYEAAKEALAKHNQGVRVPEPEQPKTKTREDGSLREENIENGNELTKVHYWKDAGQKPVVRTKLYYEKDRPNDARAYIHMLPVRGIERINDQKKAKANTFAIKLVIKDFRDFQKHNSGDVIVDFHGIEEVAEMHIAAIKALQKVIAKEGKGRKIKVTGIDSSKKAAEKEIEVNPDPPEQLEAVKIKFKTQSGAEMEKAIKEAFKTKDESKKIAILPLHHSQDPNIFDEGVPVRREEFDDRGNLVFRQYYDENGRSEKIVKVNNRAVETPIPDSNMGREFIPYNSNDVSAKEAGRKK